MRYQLCTLFLKVSCLLDFFLTFHRLINSIPPPLPLRNLNCHSVTTTDLPAAAFGLWQHPVVVHRAEWCSDLTGPVSCSATCKLCLYCAVHCPTLLPLNSLPRCLLWLRVAKLKSRRLSKEGTGHICLSCWAFSLLQFSSPINTLRKAEESVCSYRIFAYTVVEMPPNTPSLRAEWKCESMPGSFEGVWAPQVKVHIKVDRVRDARSFRNHFENYEQNRKANNKMMNTY